MLINMQSTVVGHKITNQVCREGRVYNILMYHVDSKVGIIVL